MAKDICVFRFCCTYDTWYLMCYSGYGVAYIQGLLLMFYISVGGLDSRSCSPRMVHILAPGYAFWEGGDHMSVSGLYPLPNSTMSTGRINCRNIGTHVLHVAPSGVRLTGAAGQATGCHMIPGLSATNFNLQETCFIG